MTEVCQLAFQDRRRCFWATQPCCEEVKDECGNSCCIPGMVYEEPTKRLVDKPSPCPPWDLCSAPWADCDKELVTVPPTKAIKTDGWLESLMLNMLNTNARKAPSLCGNAPAAVCGHWSESFIEADSGLYGMAQPGYRVGTNLRDIKPWQYSVRTLESVIEAELTKTLMKLVQLGLATSVVVEVRYTGDNRFNANIVAHGSTGQPLGRVDMIGARNTDAGFFWSC